MRRCGSLLLLFFLFVFFVAFAVSTSHAQVDRIVIAAGSDQDHALQDITNEPDPQKKLAMYQAFVQKFSADAAAVAYGNWQIAQAYQATGDLQKALDYGDKALAGSPHNLEILVSQIGVAQQARNNSKTMDYAAKGRRDLPVHWQGAQTRRHERRRLCRAGEPGKVGCSEHLRFSGDYRLQRHRDGD